MFIVILFFVIFIIAVLVRGLRIVKQAEVQIIERLGKYKKTLTSGVNIIIPFIDKPRPILWRYSIVTPDQMTHYRESLIASIDLREQVYDFTKQSVITKDNVTLDVDALLYFQVTDPFKTTYEINNLPNAIEKLTKTTLRNVVGELDLDGCLTSRDTINSKLRAILDEATDKWGVKVNRVELQDIVPPKSVIETMEKQMTAERIRRADILEAEGNKKSEILKSEGDKQSQINRAEGEKRKSILEAEGKAEAIMKQAEAEKNAINLVKESAKSDAVNYLVAQKYLETLKEMTSGKDNKVVYLPVETTGILSSLGGIKEMLKDVK